MKKVLKGPEPNGLKNYREGQPTNSWDQFKKSTPRKRQVQERLVADQGGLCAYCEIDLKPGTDGALADLRVEHFHPKSDDSGPTNWHLDWQNLLACCHGGSQKEVVEATDRFTSPDYSCDVPKADQDWDNVILNPLNLPAFPPLFKYRRADGAIQADEQSCDAAGIDHVRAQASIDNLRLDAERLRNLRKAGLNHINDLLRREIENGHTPSEARARLARALLRRNGDQHWPRFFTAIRRYLGNAAEQQLQSIGFIG
jgi:uncharacterized protein (TIGR02646 family)